MARPAQVELLSFRRTFTLVIMLVAVPSAGLSGFGVLAIINERAAVEKRLEAAWAGRLETVAQRLDGQLRGLQVQGRAPLLLATADGEPVTESSFAFEKGALTTEDTRLRTALGAQVPLLESLPERPVYFSVSGGGGTHLLAALRSGERVSGARLSQRGVEVLLERAGEGVAPPGEPARYVLRPQVRDVTPDGTMGFLASGVAEVREALEARELSSVGLPAPLHDLRLAAVAVGEDPVAQASSRNRTVYGVLLGLFYVTLALGVIYTGRTLYREARLSRLKTDFVSLVSHELRTPLTSIRMFIETLALGRVKDPEEQREVLQMLSRETARLSAMIESVLDWARLESGRKQFTRERVPVQAVLDAALEAFRTQRVGAAMQLEVHVETDLPAVAVDREAVAGALLNLLQNAFKYTGADKRITVRARKEARGVALSVQDNGMGIHPQEKKKIFERFYRVDNLATRTTEGTGLGLSIAQRIAHAHHGRITVESTPGQGSTFTFHLPAAEELPT